MEVTPGHSVHTVLPTVSMSSYQGSRKKNQNDKESEGLKNLHFGSKKTIKCIKLTNKIAVKKHLGNLPKNKSS